MAMCQKCGKNVATIHYQQIVNGKASEIYLCPSCAAEEGWGGGFMGMGQIGKMMASLMGQESYAPYGETTLASPVCSKCGFRLADFQHTGLLGCPDCYAEFSQQLEPVIRRVQGSLRHRGTAPGQGVQQGQPKGELELLREQLQKAIDQEEYEKAAELRDQIRSLEGGGETV